MIEELSKLPPKERIKRKKEIEVQVRQQQLAEAAKQASNNYQRAKE